MIKESAQPKSGNIKEMFSQMLKRQKAAEADADEDGCVVIEEND